MVKQCDASLKQLIKTCWDDFKTLEKYRPDLVVKNSIPILWFGDIDSYFDSEKRIVTVALNPSNKEFIGNKGTVGVEVRFPTAKSIVNKQMLDDNDCDIYKQAMCEYFSTNRLQWFCHFERILNKIGGSYGGVFNTGGNIIYTAIHIDIYSPVATNDKWNDLCRNGNDKTIISANHIAFTNLLQYLNPDMILISCNKNEINKLLKGKNKPKWSKKAGRAFINRYNYNGKVMISGLNMKGTPFGGYSEFYDQGFSEMIAAQNVFIP